MRWAKKAEIGTGVVFLAVVGFFTFQFWPRFFVRQSGEGFGVGDFLIVAQYGYSDDGDRLRYAIFRTWPKDSTTEQRNLDARTGKGFLGWPLVRNTDGRMIPVGANGDIYFFEGDNLKTLRVRMNEHTDTAPLGNMTSLEEVWTYLQQFRVNSQE
jgi:hypothetical protein